MTKIATERFEKRESKIGIIGLGYVGLPLMLRFVEVGFEVLGLDIDASKVNMLNEGKSFIKHISSKSIENALNNGFSATTDYERSGECDALIICVPTPLNKYREPDLSYITATLDSLKPYFRSGQVLSLESTTYPGTTREVIAPYLDSTDLNIGENFYIVYSPEREDPGNPNFSTQTIPKVCGGMTQNCMKVGATLYNTVIDKIVEVSSPEAAEMTKLLENIHRAVNIGLVNEMKIVADKMGIDIHEVINAAATKPFGFTAYHPGPGLGGHCIPIDPFYLTWKAREFGLHTRFIELAGEVNAAMPSFVISKITNALNNHGKALKGSRILILGIAYKKNVDDMRESPSVEIMELLTEKKANVQYSDPYVPVFPKMRDHSFDLKSIELTAETIKSYDCIVLATQHDNFNYDLILEHCSLLVDTRGVYQGDHSKVIKA